MTASLSHHRPAQQAAHLTSMVRMRLQRPPAPLPRADGALLKAALTILVAGALGTALAGGVKPYTTRLLPVPT